MIYKENNKVYSILIIFLAILFVFSIATNIDSVNGATKYVNTTSGSDGNTGNAPNAAYQSIGKAVNSSASASNPAANEIIIAGGTYYGDANTNIIVNKNISIYGAKYKGNDNKDTIISGGNLNRIFNITGGVTVYIYGIQFQNTYTTDNGGAIYSEGGTCKLYNTGFTNCNANGHGGAIDSSNANNWSFSGVTFTNCNNNNAFGGAIDSYNANNWSFSNVTFTNCYGGRGGAVYGDLGCNNWSFSGVIFTNCSSKVAGGAIYSFNVANNWSFSNVTFTNCSASEGGAVYAGFGYNNWSFSGVTFTNCGASDGGAVYINNGSFKFNSCSFINNKATNNGGAIYISSGNCTVSYSSFLDNSGYYVIYNIGTGSVVANNNWWGSNNPSGLYSGVVVNTYFAMLLSTSIANNALFVGDKLKVSYALVLNGTSDTSGSSNFLPFYVSISNNGAFVRTIDGRVSGTYDIPLSALSSSIVAKSGQGSSTLVYAAKKGNVVITLSTPSSAYYGQTLLLKGVLKDQNGNLLPNKAISLNIGGFVVNLKSNNKGEFSYNYIANGFVGSKSIKTSFSGDINYNSGSKTSAFTVNKATTSLSITNFKGLFKKSNVIIATIKDQNGKVVADKSVNFYVNGKIIATAKTNSVGVASFKYTFKTRKVHNIIAKFGGDTFYLAKNSATFKAIPKDKSSTSLAKFQAKYNKKATLKATLKNNLKKPMAKKLVKFYANGKYLGQAKTNAKGIATLTKKIIVKGSVNFVAKYAGDKIYHESSYTQKVTVK